MNSRSCNTASSQAGMGEWGLQLLRLCCTGLYNRHFTKAQGRRCHVQYLRTAESSSPAGRAHCHTRKLALQRSSLTAWHRSTVASHTAAQVKSERLLEHAVTVSNSSAAACAQFCACGRRLDRVKMCHASNVTKFSGNSFDCQLFPVNAVVQLAGTCSSDC